MWRWVESGMAALWAAAALSACGGSDALSSGGGNFSKSVTNPTPARHEAVVAAREFTFAFQLDKPGQVSAFTSGDVDTHGSLRDTTLPPPAELAQDETSGEGENFRVEAALNTGTYELFIVARDVPAKPYILTVLFEAAPAE